MDNSAAAAYTQGSASGDYLYGSARDMNPSHVTVSSGVKLAVARSVQAGVVVVVVPLNASIKDVLALARVVLDDDELEALAPILDGPPEA
jgi:hypothetical protein